MLDNKNNKKKIHNPKSFAPSVYIPFWLIQVPHEELSFGAKLLYGRIAQWSSTSGNSHRSSLQLSKEMGMGQRTIEKFIKELKDCGLIGTYQVDAGGVNHFEFYDHEWMHRELTKELGFETYNSVNLVNSVDKSPTPPAQPCGTPPHNHAVLNIKEIKKTNIEREGHLAHVDKLVIEDPGEHEKLSDESFDIFYANYPRQKNENRARCAWLSQSCYKIFNEIMESLYEQIKHDDDFKSGFAPNPDKYILNERWKDKPIMKKNKYERYVADDTDLSWAKNIEKDIL
jgi:hypothetical protein